LPDLSTLKGKRDRAMLALLIGCGLRRSEAAGLNVEDIQQRDGRWVISDLLGKHGRIRTVPMPGWAKVVDVWLASAGITTGHIFCAVHKGGGILRH
jgi:integrase